MSRRLKSEDNEINKRGTCAGATPRWPTRGWKKRSFEHSRSLHLKTVSISLKDPVSLPSGKEPSVPIMY